MPDRLSEIEARLERVEEAVRALSRGAQPSRLLPGTHTEIPGVATVAVLQGAVDSTALLTLAGRTLMILGGAYALRALTESGNVPTYVGVLLGAAYALLWLGAADRACASRPLSGFFHGLAAVLIGLPLLWEASTHFQLLTSVASAMALAGVTVLASGVAWHRRMQSLAALTILGSLAASAAFIVKTGEPLPFAGTVLVAGIATLWLAESRGWRWLAWAPALAADLLFVGFIGRASSTPPVDAPPVVIGLQLVLVFVYLAFVAWRTFGRNERVWPFDVVQVPLALALGLGGALVVSRVMGAGVTHTSVVALTLLLAAAGYAVAFLVLNREPHPVTTFSFYATVALALAFAGIIAALPASPLVLAFGALAFGATTLGARFAQPTLALHGALFNLSTALASGLLGLTLVVWLASSGWPTFDALQVFAIVVALWCAAIPRATPGDDRQRSLALLALAARVLVALVAIIGLGGALVYLAGARSGGPVGPGSLATIRTATLAGAALALAGLGRTRRFLEFGWFVYPVLVVGALKLGVDDFLHSTAGWLFLALAAYGAALVLAPRVLRRQRRA